MSNLPKVQHSNKKPTQTELVKKWLLDGERLDVMSVRKRTGNFAFHLFGRINELKKRGFRFYEEFVSVAEGSPYKVIWLHDDFVADIKEHGLDVACLIEKNRQAMAKEMGA